MEPSPSPIENTHLSSTTITHSQYLRENITFKRKSNLVIASKESQPVESRVTKFGIHNELEASVPGLMLDSEGQEFEIT